MIQKRRATKKGGGMKEGNFGAVSLIVGIVALIFGVLLVVKLFETTEPKTSTKDDGSYGLFVVCIIVLGAAIAIALSMGSWLVSGFFLAIVLIIAVPMFFSARAQEINKIKAEEAKKNARLLAEQQRRRDEQKRKEDMERERRMREDAERIQRVRNEERKREEQKEAQRRAEEEIQRKEEEIRRRIKDEKERQRADEVERMRKRDELIRSEEDNKAAQEYVSATHLADELFQFKSYLVYETGFDFSTLRQDAFFHGYMHGIAEKVFSTLNENRIIKLDYSAIATRALQIVFDEAGLTLITSGDFSFGRSLCKKDRAFESLVKHCKMALARQHKNAQADKLTQAFKNIFD